MAKIESDSIEQEAEEVNQWLAFNNLPTETTYSRYLAASMIDPSFNVKNYFASLYSKSSVFEKQVISP